MFQFYWDTAQGSTFTFLCRKPCMSGDIVNCWFMYKQTRVDKWLLQIGLPPILCSSLSVFHLLLSQSIGLGHFDKL